MAAVNTSILLKELLPSSVEVTGTVDTHNADGTSTVSLTSGGSVVALGQSVAVAGVALVRDNEVVAEAQVLPAFTLEV